MNIRVVSKSDCPFCKMAKTWFEDHGFPYEEQLMDNEEERLAFYQSLTNGVGEIVGQSDTVRRVNSVPQIFIDDTGGISPSEMRSRARKVAREHGELRIRPPQQVPARRRRGVRERRRSNPRFSV